MPGTYAITDYAVFLEKVSATTDEGSYFTIKKGDQPLTSIRYQADVKRMERNLAGGFVTSKLRDNYLGCWATQYSDLSIVFRLGQFYWDSDKPPESVASYSFADSNVSVRI